MSIPIVGAHFRPPAKAILQAIPLEHPLELRAEPENSYDPNAIAVWIATSSLESLPTVTQQTLATLSTGFGHDWDSLLSQPCWHLGYVPRTMTGLVHPKLGASGRLPVHLSTTSAGAPAIGGL